MNNKEKFYIEIHKAKAQFNLGDWKFCNSSLPQIVNILLSLWDGSYFGLIILVKSLTFGWHFEQFK